jgi:phage nucleotide-binding protein
MAIQLKRTRDFHTSGVKLLVYGQAGAGKTTLAATLPAPLILSAEGGLLSIAGHDLPYIEIATMADLGEAYRFVTESAEAAAFESIALDSISEIAEVLLTHEKAATKDPRKAYGEMADQMAGMIRNFRDIPGKHVYMSAKMEKAQDETGRMLYSPSMPGNKTAQSLPYFFDEVLALLVEKDSEGTTQRALLCDSDGTYQAKDRSGRLEMWEAPDLGGIINKIKG